MPTIFWTNVCLSSISFLSIVNWTDTSSTWITEFDTQLLRVTISRLFPIDQNLSSNILTLSLLGVIKEELLII